MNLSRIRDLLGVVLSRHDGRLRSRRCTTSVAVGALAVALSSTLAASQPAPLPPAGGSQAPHTVAPADTSSPSGAGAALDVQSPCGAFERARDVERFVKTGVIVALIVALVFWALQWIRWWRTHLGWGGGHLVPLLLGLFVMPFLLFRLLVREEESGGGWIQAQCAYVGLSESAVAWWQSLFCLPLFVAVFVAAYLLLCVAAFFVRPGSRA